MAAITKVTGTVSSTAAYTVLWSKVSGPGTVTFSAATSLTTGVSFSLAGTYVLKLTVTTLTSTVEDTITIVGTANIAPVVNAGADFTCNQTINANIVGSYTTDGLPALRFFNRFSTTVSGAPATGTVRINNAAPLSATQLNFSITDRFGFNRQVDLLSIPANSVIRLTNSVDSSRWLQFTCGAPSLVSGYVTCTMSSVTVSHNPPFADTTPIDFTPVFTPTGSWAMTSGTGTATFGNSSALATTVSFSTTGAKVLTLSVNDGNLTGTDTVGATVNTLIGSDFVRATAQAVPGGVSLTSDGTPFMVDMSRFPNGWWTAVDAAGATIRVCTGLTTTQRPFDLIRFDKAAKTGQLVFNAQAVAAGYVVDVYCGTVANTAYAATDTFGRYNVYRTGIMGFWPAGGGNDRTRNARNCTTVGSPTIGTGPIGAQSYLYSATARSIFKFPAVISGPVAFFCATNTTSPSSSSWFHAMGLNRSAAGTLNSNNNSVYLTAVGVTLSAIMSEINGSGVYQAAVAQCTAETWKALAGVRASDVSRQASTANTTSAVNGINNIVTSMDFLSIGQTPNFSGGVGPTPNPNLSLCYLWNESVNPVELAYMDLMLKQTTFWPTWTLNP